jgi:hypothetical protein
MREHRRAPCGRVRKRRRFSQESNLHDGLFTGLSRRLVPMRGKSRGNLILGKNAFESNANSLLAGIDEPPVAR